MPEYQHPPIRRAEALAPFSRDHYAGLVQARRLQKAAGSDAPADRRRAIAEFIDAWDREIAEHFRDEERLLPDHLDPADRDRLLEEHRRLGAEAEQARQLRRTTDPDAAALDRLGRDLEQHIRWEERELFERIQQRLGEDASAELESRTQEIERRRPRNIRRG